MKTADIPVIKLTGTPRERGRIYGEAAKLLIARVVQAWREDLGNFKVGSASVPNSEPNAYLSEFLSKTNYIAAVQLWTPHLWEEVQGIAEGAEQHVDNILGLQLIDEEWVFGLHRNLDKPTAKCTAFGVSMTNNNPSYAGQNMDIPSWVEGYQVLLRVTPTATAPEALVFSIAGSIGLNGVNAAGLGVTCNALPQLSHSSDGLPVLFIIRSILEKRTIDEAERFLSEIPHASGQNYILSSRHEMRCFECSASRVDRYAPQYLQGRVFHTNHVLVNPDRSVVAAQVDSKPNSSRARLDSIETRLGNASRTVTLEDAKAALSAHDDPANSVSRVINPHNSTSSIGYTAGSSIYELGDTPRLHLAAGPPCETEFKVFDFKTHTDQQ